MNAIALLLGLALGGASDSPECRNPPSRSSDAYWSFIEACGCAKVDPVPRASLDYDRFMKACSQWRERNTQIVAPRSSRSPECRNPPSSASASFWDFIDACGCASLEPPSRASGDYDRYMKACSDWRERNPGADASGPGGPAKEKPGPTPSPGATPQPSPRP
jgi:hypothetical protein